MNFGIWQLWAVLALAGAAQLYLLWRMLRQADFGRFRRAPQASAAPQPLPTVSGTPESSAAPRVFGKRPSI